MGKLGSYFLLLVFFSFQLIGCGGSDLPEGTPPDVIVDNTPSDPEPRVTGIYTTNSNVSLLIGEAHQFTIMATYDDGSEKDISDSPFLSMIDTVYLFDYGNAQHGIISVNGLEMTSEETGIGFIEIGYNYYDPDTNTYQYFPIRVNITSGYAVPVDLHGLWQFVHSGEEKWLSNVLEFQYTKIDNNQLRLIDRDGKNYYLIRAGIADVQVSGQLAVIENPALKRKFGKTLSVGDISLLLENIKTEDHTVVTPNSDGSFDVVLPSTNYDLIATDTITGESIRAEVEVSGTEVDVGQFTLVDSTSHNFKTHLLKEHFSDDNEYFYFGTLPGQQEIVYNKKIRVTNVGDLDVSGISFNIAMTDPDVRVFDVTTTLGGMAAGDYIDIPVSFSFNRPSTNKTIRIGITITDINNQQWNDYINIALSKEKPVKISVKSLGDAGVNGYLITPGRKLIKMNWLSESLRIPYIPGDSYQVAFANPDISNEDAYCVNVGYEQGCYQTVFDGFTQTAVNEPDNNQLDSTQLNLFDESLAYLAVGDIDYLNFTFDASREPFEGINIATLVTTGLASDLSVQGNYAYIADSNSGVHIVDISAPSSPTIINTIPEFGSTQEVIVENNIAYIFDYGWGLRIYDVTDPLNPVSLSQIDVNGIANGGTVVNNIAYVAKLTDGLQLVDVTDPTAPALLGAIDTTGWASDVEVVGNIAYVADGAAGLQLVDISNPSLPVLGSQNSDHGSVYDISIVNNKAYFSGFTGLYIYDVATPASPSFLGSIGGISSARDVFETQNMAFVVDNYGVYVLDIRNSTRPVIISKLKNVSATGLIVQNDKLFVSDLNQGLKVFNYMGGL